MGVAMCQEIFIYTTTIQPSLQIFDGSSVNQKTACTGWPEIKRGRGAPWLLANPFEHFSPVPNVWQDIRLIDSNTTVSSVCITYDVVLSHQAFRSTNRNAAHKWVTASALITESNPSRGGIKAKPQFKAAVLKWCLLSEKWEIHLNSMWHAEDPMRKHHICKRMTVDASSLCNFIGMMRHKIHCFREGYIEVFNKESQGLATAD